MTEQDKYNDEYNFPAEQGLEAGERPDLVPDPERSPEAVPPRDEEPSLGAKIIEWVKVIVVAVALGLLITTFVIQRNTVFGDSMLPTLNGRDELIVEKVSKWFGGIEQGDIVTVHMAGVDYGGGESNIIKRVIGVPGDRIELKDGQVFRNGELLEETYLADGMKTRIIDRRYADVTLGENEYYLMGDNRSVSLDSRRFGPVQKQSIIGEVLIRVWPFSRFGRP